MRERRQQDAVTREYAGGILERHLTLGEVKPVSYLPLKTITDVLGITVGSYVAMALDRRLSCLSLGPSDSCISSGAVYAFDAACLSSVLAQHQDVLNENGWPSDNAAFIRRMAANWLDEQDPVLPVIRRLFGEL